MMNSLKKTLSGWGLYPRTHSFVCRPEKIHDLLTVHTPYIARGCGRCYGDAAQLTDGYVVLMERLDRMLSFDAEMGVLRAEAGVTLKDIADIFVPKGWFLPVTPGTKWVTLGGCVAADVHGKNHHIDGSFGQHVLSLELITPDRGRVRCSPVQEEALFWATIGGMGLTGIITEVTLQLLSIPSAYIAVKNYAARNLDKLFDRLSDPLLDDKYSVAWVDCLSKGENFGRGIMMNGHHADADELTAKQVHPFRVKKSSPMQMPFYFSSVLLSARTIEKCNRLYYTYYGAKKEALVDYDRYFYPLDVVSNWNQVYGKKGFVQYQFATPSQPSREVCRLVLKELADAGFSPYLAVLKRFGPQDKGYLSFPIEGFTLALDIPIRNETLFPLLDKLDTVVVRSGGRVYLAKDSRMRPEVFKGMYAGWEAWKEIKRKVDHRGVVTSDLAKRLQML
jgi:FAD/FMN-containing dehydrogenase